MGKVLASVGTDGSWEYSPGVTPERILSSTIGGLAATGKFVREQVVENTVPTIGGILGGTIFTGLAGPAGTLPGAAIGSGLARTGQEALMGATPEEAIGKGVTEAGGTYVSSKALGLLADTPLGKAFLNKLGSMMTTKAEDIGITTKQKDLRKSFGLFLSHVFQRAPKEEQEQLATEAGEKLAAINIPKKVTNRLFRKGGDTVLREEYTDTLVKRRVFGEEGADRSILSAKTSGKISSMADDIKANVRENYETNLSDILDPKEEVATTGLAESIREKLSEGFKVSPKTETVTKQVPRRAAGFSPTGITVEETGVQTVKQPNLLGKIDPIYVSEDTLRRRANVEVDRINRYILSKKNVSLKQLHELKRELNGTIDALDRGGHPTARDIFISIRKDVVDMLENSNPAYRSTNREYAGVMELADQLKGTDKLDAANNLLHKYYTDPVVETRMNMFLKNASPRARADFENALDEKAATYFFQGDPEKHIMYKNVGVKLPFVPAGFGGIQVGGLVPSKLVKSIQNYGVPETYLKSKWINKGAQSFGAVGVSPIFTTAPNLAIEKYLGERE